MLAAQIDNCPCPLTLSLEALNKEVDRGDGIFGTEAFYTGKRKHDLTNPKPDRILYIAAPIDAYRKSRTVPGVSSAALEDAGDGEPLEKVSD